MCTPVFALCFFFIQCLASGMQMSHGVMTYFYRRKLRNDILREFPHITQELASEIIPNKEDMSVMKIMTHSGANVTAYTLNGSPIFFQVETKLYPTGSFSQCHLPRSRS
jgi:predicted ribosome-associated RNA-binding protein Tma20